jgi:hypothetical protein
MLYSPTATDLNSKYPAELVITPSIMVESLALYKVTVAYSTGVLLVASTTLPLITPEISGDSQEADEYG